MAKYRKISPRIWSDAKFCSVSDDSKLLFLFVLTHPHMSSVGAMRGTIPGFASEIGWNLQRTAKGFGELFAKGLLNYDESASAIVAKNFIRHNTPENPNVVKAWALAFDDLPECELIASHFQTVKEFLKEYTKPFQEPFDKPFRKGLANQEQEQEQEQDKSIAHPRQHVNGVERLTALGVDEQAAKDWIAIRKAHRAPLTETAVKDLQCEAGKAGIPVARAVLICARKSWRGFNHAWKWQDADEFNPAEGAL